MPAELAAHSFSGTLAVQLAEPVGDTPALYWLGQAGFVLDAGGRVLIWNRACERLTGVRASEVVGTSDHWRAFYDEPRLCLADVLAKNVATDLGRLYSFHTEPSAHGLGMKAENWCVMPVSGERRYLAVDAGPDLRRPWHADRRRRNPARHHRPEAG